MPCGCSGGKWEPPAQQKSGEDAKQAGQKKPEPAATGPAAPGYYHTGR